MPGLREPVRDVTLSEVVAAQVLAVSEVVGSQPTNFLNVYRLLKGGTSFDLIYGGINFAAGTQGSPGGNGAGAHPPFAQDMRTAAPASCILDASQPRKRGAASCVAQDFLVGCCGLCGCGWDAA